MKLIALLLAWRVAAAAATSPEYAVPGAVYFANPIGEDFPVRRDRSGDSEPSSRKLAVAASTTPGHVVKDRYIVKLCETSWLDREPAETAAALAESVGAKVKHVYQHMLSGFSVTGSAEAADALRNKPEVCGVQPALWLQKHEIAGSGQEPYDAIDTWGKDRVLGGKAGNPTGGKGVSIVIIDTGLDTQHVEFSNTDERAVANIADCVDNWKYYEPWGWDTLAAANKTVADTLNTDFNAHGTHVSGSAGGKNVGIAPGADIFMIKAGNLQGFKEDDELCAMEIIAEALDQGHLTERTVMSASLGGACQAGLSPDPEVPGGNLQNPAVCRNFSQSLDGTDDFFQPFLEKGVAITLAAGNYGDDACFYTPGASSSAVTVGASDQTDRMAPLSNFGACIDTVAPGIDIWSSLTSHLVVATNTTPAGAQDMYRIMNGTSMAAPLVAGTTALFLEAIGADASALDAQYAMLHANEPSALAPNLAQNTSAVPSCPTNAALVQAPGTVDGGFDKSFADPAAGCQLAEPRLFGFENGSSPEGQCDVKAQPFTNSTYTFMLFNADPRLELCMLMNVGGTVYHTPNIATGVSVQIPVPAGTSPAGQLGFQLNGLPKGSNETCDKGELLVGNMFLTLEPNMPGWVVGWVEPTPQAGPLVPSSGTYGPPGFFSWPRTNQNSFVNTAAGVGNCALFIRNSQFPLAGYAGLKSMGGGFASDYVNYGYSAPTNPMESCFGIPDNITGTVQMVLTCTDGVDSWTTTKDICPDWFCPDAVIIWVAAYSEADGLQLSVIQSRTCGKEESCAAGGHDDNDDNDDHKHSDGAPKLGPLAALFIAAITIITL